MAPKIRTSTFYDPTFDMGEPAGVAFFESFLGTRLAENKAKRQALLDGLDPKRKMMMQDSLQKRINSLQKLKADMAKADAQGRSDLMDIWSRMNIAEFNGQAAMSRSRMSAAANIRGDLQSQMRVARNLQEGAGNPTPKFDQFGKGLGNREETEAQMLERLTQVLQSAQSGVDDGGSRDWVAVEMLGYTNDAAAALRDRADAQGDARVARDLRAQALRLDNAAGQLARETITGRDGRGYAPNDSKNPTEWWMNQYGPATADELEKMQDQVVKYGASMVMFDIPAARAAEEAAVPGGIDAQIAGLQARLDDIDDDIAGDEFKRNWILMGGLGNLATAPIATRAADIQPLADRLGRLYEVDPEAGAMEMARLSMAPEYRPEREILPGMPGDMDITTGNVADNVTAQMLDAMEALRAAQKSGDEQAVLSAVNAYDAIADLADTPRGREKTKTFASATEGMELADYMRMFANDSDPIGSRIQALDDALFVQDEVLGMEWGYGGEMGMEFAERLGGVLEAADSDARTHVNAIRDLADEIEASPGLYGNVGDLYLKEVDRLLQHQEFGLFDLRVGEMYKGLTMPGDPDAINYQPPDPRGHDPGRGLGHAGAPLETGFDATYAASAPPGDLHITQSSDSVGVDYKEGDLEDDNWLEVTGSTGMDDRGMTPEERARDDGESPMSFAEWEAAAEDPSAVPRRRASR